MPTRKRSFHAFAVAAATALTLSIFPTLGCAQSGRVLERDLTDGGPPGVELADLGPLFPESDLRAALEELSNNRGLDAINAFGAWLQDNPDDPRFAQAAFIHAYATYVRERWSDAVPLLVECERVAPEFADYCMFWAADASLRIEDPSAAEAYASVVSPSSVMGPRAAFIRGRALLADQRYDDAVEALEAFVARYPSAWYRDDAEFALAEAYVGRGDADEAARTYARIALVNPGGAEETRAQAALEALSGEVSPSVLSALRNPSNADTLERARVLYDRHRSEQVIELLEPVVAQEQSGTSVFCEASYLVAKSYSKLRQHRDSIPPYEAVVEHCDDEDLVVKAMYNAGRGAWNVDEDADAIAWFEQLWSNHADHSYADDAMLLAARVHRSNEEEEEYVELLRQQIDEFPEGDMLKDAVWLLVQRQFEAGEFREVVRFVDELGSRTGENDIYSRGRLGYFRARSLEALSLQNEARGGYVAVVRSNPMAYYSLLSLNRLHDLDPERAQELVDELAQGGERTEGMITISPAEASRDPQFLRGRAFLRMGLYDLAEGEFAAWRSAYPNEDEIGWVVSLMYHHAGAFERSHHVPGERLDLNLAYPAPGNLERWQVAYPTPFEESVTDAANALGLDRYWVYAIMREESGFRPEIESWANARGLLQLMEGTANDMAQLTGRGSVRASELFDPEINIELGTQFMRTLADRFDAHPALIFAGYNGGHGNVNSWLRARGDMPLDLWVEEIPYAQTRHYVKRVTMTWWVYHWLEGDRLPTLDWDLSDI